MKTEKWISSRLRYGGVWTRTTCFSFEHAGLPGVPDLYCVTREASSFWLELKVVAGANSLLPFRPHQPQWLDEHHAAGGRAYILVWLDAPGSLALYRAENVRSLARRKLAAAEAWKIGEKSLSAPDTWEEVEDMCLGHPRGKGQQDLGPLKRAGRAI